MNRNILFKLILLLMSPVLFLNCQVEKKHSMEADEMAVKEALINMWEAIEEGDIDRYAAYVHPDFTQFGENDSLIRIGKKAEIEGIDSWIQNSENIHTEMENPRVTIKNDVAWIVYYWKDHGITNGEAFATRGKSTRIFVKEGGKWLCIHGHYTSLP